MLIKRGGLGVDLENELDEKLRNLSFANKPDLVNKSLEVFNKIYKEQPIKAESNIPQKNRA